MQKGEGNHTHLTLGIVLYFLELSNVFLARIFGHLQRPYNARMKVVAQNRRARYDYAISETVEAGILLTGPEVKSCRKGHINLSGSYVSFLGGKAILKGAGISKYAFSGPDVLHEEHRDRPLLLKKNELAKLQRASEEKGMTIVPLEVRAGKFIKIVIGLGRGKKKMDKREAIKARETGRRLREGREI